MPLPIAIISNSQTPYRIHLHQRVARELPQVVLWSLYTHEISNSAWPFDAPDEIRPVLFGKGESCLNQDKPAHALREWKRGGCIICWLKEHGIGFVLMMGYNDVGRLRIIRWCRRNGVPCFLFGDSNIHGDTAVGIKAAIKKIVVSRIVRSCDGVLACGTLGKAYFAKYGARADRMFCFPYEPDYRLIQTLSSEQIDRVRQQFGLPVGRRRLVYSGRLIQIKRVDLLIDAFIAIAALRPTWDLVIVGDGPLHENLRAQVPTELAGRIIWTGFADDQSTVSAIYRASDVLVLPSDYEPWALVINEAAAAGMAIVSSNVVGAAAELVRDNENGRLFPPGDLAALIQCLLDVTDPQKTESMRKASAGLLAQWRERGDPVKGLRDAIRSVGLLR